MTMEEFKLLKKEDLSLEIQDGKITGTKEGGDEKNSG